MMIYEEKQHVRIYFFKNMVSSRHENTHVNGCRLRRQHLTHAIHHIRTYTHIDILQLTHRQLPIELNRIFRYFLL